MLQFSSTQSKFLQPYLPSSSKTPSDNDDNSNLSFITLTFATSLDSALALRPGVRTILSGPKSKAMTHYLRSKHDSILVGVGTVIADDPGLNCRIEGVGGYGGEGLTGQPRPVIVDPQARWEFTRESKVFQLSRQNQGRSPIIIVAIDTEILEDRKALLHELGGKLLYLPLLEGKKQFNWEDVFKALRGEGIKSIMVEGGGLIINTLLQPKYENLVSAVIVTIAPTWLGEGGVMVSPPARYEDRLGQETQPIAAARLKDVLWQPMGEDVVLCGRLKH